MIILKSCDICGTLNFRENNYCTHCGNKFLLENFCVHCGCVNDDNASFCIKCGKPINPISIDSFDVLFNEYNENLLLNASITDEEYNELLKKIFLRANFTNIVGDSIKDKIINLASVFTLCKTKSRGYERGYAFFNNYIYYDDRLDESVQIATIIHELAHYLLFTIVESLLCEIFNVETSSTLQSFVWYFLTLPEFKIMNEFCAHTVEGRFIPHGYQNYGSFNILIKKTSFDEDSIKTIEKLGNSFANEIIVYLEKYIDENLREEIKLQYKMDLKNPNYDSIINETDDCFALNVKNDVLLRMLFNVLKEASNVDVRDELESIKEGIELI